MTRRTTPLAVALVCLVAFLAVPSTATATTPPGPRLRVTAAQAASALDCHGRLDRGRAPVLFLHGTTSNSEANWSWNWNRALDQRHWSYCTLDLPQSGNGDIQLAAEYVVRSIRTMHHRAGRKISLVGHSQGGMIGRWALKWWPDTRAMVGDYVGLSSSNHGTDVFGTLCTTGVCSAANWQQRTGSAFLKALNRGREVFPGIDYTSISTRQDEIVVPSTSPYLLRGRRAHVTNVAVQNLCPTETVDHFGMAYDNAAWLIGLDALTHAGPARLARVDDSTCGQPLMPGVDPATFPTELLAALVQTGTSTVAAHQLPAEPALRPYAR